MNLKMGFPERVAEFGTIWHIEFETPRVQKAGCDCCAADSAGSLGEFRLFFQRESFNLKPEVRKGDR